MALSMWKRGRESATAKRLDCTDDACTLRSSNRLRAQAALLTNCYLPPTLLREDRTVRVRVGDFAIRVLSSLT